MIVIPFPFFSFFTDFFENKTKQTKDVFG